MGGMKIAILSDIHGNLPALYTVTNHIETWKPDLVIVNGDVINRGPKPAACLHFLLEKQETAGWQLIQGNHEEYVIRHSHPDAVNNGRFFEINRPSFWTFQQLNEDVTAIAGWPSHQSIFAPDGSQVYITHASRRGNRDSILPHTPIEKVRQQIAPAPALFATAHIHHAFTRKIDQTLIVNSGSAGQLCFGDKRASYAQIVWRNGRWQVKLIHLPYDTEETERDFHQSGFLEEAGPVAQIIYHEWRSCRSLVPRWLSQFQPRVLAGEIDLETAVSQYLTHMML